MKLVKKELLRERRLLLQLQQVAELIFKQRNIIRGQVGG